MFPQRSIPCNIDSLTGVLFPSSPGVTVALITFQQTDVGGVTAVLAFGGSPKAFLNLDDTGRNVLGYTLTVHDQATAQSVENIISSF